MLNFVLFQFHLLKTNYQPISLLTEEQNLFPFFKSYFGIYVTSRICKLCLPSLLKNLQSLFSSYMTFITSFFSYSILHESFIFSICIQFLDTVWIISLDLSSSLLILSLAALSHFQTPPLGICIQCTIIQSVVFRAVVLISPGSFIEMKIPEPSQNL